MLSHDTAPSMRKPTGSLAAAVHGPSCPANYATFVIAVLDSQARPMEAPGS